MTKLSDAAKLLGKIGGKHGTGKSKRRSKEHYRRMVAARRKVKEGMSRMRKPTPL